MNRSTPGRPGRSGGFTLVELLVVVGIAAVLAAIALPNALGITESGKLQAATSMLAGKLNEARMSALKRNRSVWLQVDASAGRVQIRAAAGGGGSEDIGAPGLLPSGVGFVDPAPTITFDSMGRPTNAPPRTLTVEVARSRARRSVTVSAAGTVRRE